MNPTQSRLRVPRKFRHLSALSPRACILLGLGFAITAALTWLSLHWEGKHRSELFELQVMDIQGAIERRLVSYELMLNGGAAMFSTSGMAGRSEWADYVRSLKVEERLPGVQGLGFTEFIPAASLMDHEARIRAEGFPDYRVWPPGPHDFFTSIIYLEPFQGRNLRAFGYDMMSESIRRQAMVLACDTGLAAMTGAVTLVQEQDVDIQRGFLIYLPVYRKGMPLGSKEDRKAALRGFVYSPFRINDMLKATLGGSFVGMGIELYDGQNPSAETLLYDNDISTQISAAGEALTLRREIRFGGHSWTLFISAQQPGLWRSLQSTIIAGTGITISLLLFVVFSGAVRREERAKAMATEMTAALRIQAEELKAENQVRIAAEERAKEAGTRLSEILSATGIGTWEWDLQSNRIVVDEQWTRLASTAVPADADLTPEQLVQFCHENDRDRFKRFLEEVATATERFVALEMQMQSQGGVQSWVMDRARVVSTDENGRPLRVLGIRADNTKRAEAVLRLESQKRELELAASVYNTSREGIIITDVAGTILRCNESVRRITGFAPEEVIGNNPRMFASGRQDTEFYRQMWEKLLKDGHWEGEVWNRNKEGQVYAELLRIAVIRGEDGKITNYVSTFSDITREKEHKQELERIAYYDALTGLANRVLLTDRLRQAILSARRESRLCACLFIDLDGFKAVNDTHGHDVGDILLIEVASRMRSSLREMDTLSRIGGDEFVAIVNDLQGVTAAEVTLVRLLNAICQPVQVGAITAQVSASIGVSFFSHAEEVEPDQLIRQADHAMYQSKLRGKNCFTIFDPESDREIRDHHETISRIRQGLANGEFQLFYQPKADTNSGEIIGAEALIRWQHPERGLVPPVEFLPEIAGQPVEVEIGDWVIDTALDQMANWASRSIRVPVSVNVNLYHLERTGFVDRLQRALAARPTLEPDDFTLEILESSNFNDERRVVEVMNACDALGIGFALDDFGTGYSSMAHLRRLPVRQLKIDQSFVRDILNNDGDAPIVGGIIALANVFGLEVIAEGVENERIARKLASMGCCQIQGYFLSCPLPAHEFEDWLNLRAMAMAGTPGETV